MHITEAELSGVCMSMPVYAFVCVCVFYACVCARMWVGVGVCVGWSICMFV